MAVMGNDKNVVIADEMVGEAANILEAPRGRIINIGGCHPNAQTEFHRVFDIDKMLGDSRPS